MNPGIEVVFSFFKLEDVNEEHDHFVDSVKLFDEEESHPLGFVDIVKLFDEEESHPLGAHAI